MKNLCENCAHYTPTDWPQCDSLAFAGRCDLMGDSNDNHSLRVAEDRAAGWDQESIRAGVFVGPKFGCIHWTKAEAEHAEMRRRAALFPELLEALKLAQQIIGHPDDAHSKLIAAAIAKAEGK